MYPYIILAFCILFPVALVGFSLFVMAKRSDDKLAEFDRDAVKKSIKEDNEP